MQLKWTNALAVTALVATAGVATAQNPNTTGTWIGLEAGIYMPTDRVIRDAFGTSLPRFGINFINNQQPDKLKPTLNFSVIGANKNGNRFLAIPVTAGVGQQFGKDDSAARPYWRAGAGLAYFDYSIDPGGGNISGRKFGFSAVGEVGVLVSQRVRLSVAYNYFTKQDDFNFSGWDLKISFLLWRL